MKTLYNLAISILQLIFYCGRFFNQKLNLGYQGRKNWKQQLVTFKANHPARIIWIHCASLGEFEMARPLIDELNQNKLDDVSILVSFFSPSGYELRKNYNSVDGVIYMPFDTRKNAKEFVNTLKPIMAIFVKYEFWLNHIHELKQQRVKIILLNGVFRKNQVFFKWWGKIFRDGLKNFDVLFLQNKASEKLLHNLVSKYYAQSNHFNWEYKAPQNGASNPHATFVLVKSDNPTFFSVVTGDLRYDRVFANSLLTKPFPMLDTFLSNAFVIIGGSTWDEEEWILKQCVDTLGSAVKLIIAPHDVSERHLKQIEKRFQDNRLKRFSEMTVGDNPQIILVDTVGHLSSLYRYGQLALVGGGFSGQLHNIIEPAVYGIPVFFGFKYSKFPEASYFLNHKIGTKIHNGFNFTEHVKDILANPKYLDTIKHKTIKVFKPHLGGTQQVYYKIKSFFYNGNG